MKSYKSWTHDPIPLFPDQIASFFFFFYKGCIPNQPLIRKINLLKGSVTPRGIFCGRSGRWKKKEERRETEWYSLGLRDFECFFPRAPVSPGSTKSPQSFHGSVARCVCSGTLCFPDTWTLEGSTWREGPASRRSTGREVEPVVCSRTYCASNDPVYGVISWEKQSECSRRFRE